MKHSVLFGLKSVDIILASYIIFAYTLLPPHHARSIHSTPENHPFKSSSGRAFRQIFDAISKKLNRSFHPSAESSRSEGTDPAHSLYDLDISRHSIAFSTSSEI